MPKKKIAVHLPEMVSKDLLSEHPNNSNKQKKHMFKELRESIRTNGFDETLTIAPRTDALEGYWIVAGNHRFRAGVAEGMEEFPCVIRDDWDQVSQEIEMVRRNYVRGDIDKDAFTLAVNSLVEEQSLSLNEVREAMGFENIDTFMELYREEQEKTEKMLREAAEHSTTAGAVKMIDDLGLVLSKIFEEHGDTVPNSFIIFPAGGRNHLFVAATPSLVKSLTTIAEYSIANHLDINVILGGLLTIGIEQSNMFEGNTAEIAERGSEKDGSDEF